MGISKELACLTFGVIVAMCVGGCGSKATDGGVPVIDLEQGLSEGAVDHLDRTGWKVESVDLAVTDSTVISYGQIAGISEERVWVYDENALYRYSLEGECESVIGRRGTGPGEYLYLRGAVVFPSGESGLLDVRGSIHFYSDAGKWERTVQDNLTSLQLTPGGMTGICYPRIQESTEAYSPTMCLVWLNDKGLATDSIAMPNEMGPNNGVLYNAALMEVGGKPGVLVTDTVFSLAERGERLPMLAFHTGKYALPYEVANDFDRAEERKYYIFLLGAQIWNDLVFVEYNYDQKLYHDVWSLTDRKLVFRNISSGFEEGIGMPLELSDGRTVRVWPARVMGNRLMGMVFPFAQIEEPGDGKGDEPNPGVFFITI